METETVLNNIKTYIHDLYSHYTEKGGGYNYRYYHALRVHDMVMRYINETTPDIDSDSLRIACLLHDIGKLKDTDGNEINLDADESIHCVEGAKEAERILTDMGVTEQGTINTVAKIILHHHDEVEDFEEVQILQDADTLDEFGYLNVWKMFGFSFQHNQSPFHCCAYWEKEYARLKDQVDAKFSIPFFREMAKARLKRCSEFMETFRKELESRD